MVIKKAGTDTRTECGIITKHDFGLNDEVLSELKDSACLTITKSCTGSTTVRFDSNSWMRNHPEIIGVMRSISRRKWMFFNFFMKSLENTSSKRNVEKLSLKLTQRLIIFSTFWNCENITANAPRLHDLWNEVQRSKGLVETIFNCQDGDYDLNLKQFLLRLDQIMPWSDAMTWLPILRSMTEFSLDGVFQVVSTTLERYEEFGSLMDVGDSFPALRCLLATPPSSETDKYLFSEAQWAIKTEFGKWKISDFRMLDCGDMVFQLLHQLKDVIPADSQVPRARLVEALSIHWNPAKGEDLKAVFENKEFWLKVESIFCWLVSYHGPKIDFLRFLRNGEVMAKCNNLWYPLSDYKVSTLNRLLNAQKVAEVGEPVLDFVKSQRRPMSISGFYRYMAICKEKEIDHLSSLGIATLSGLDSVILRGDIHEDHWEKISENFFNLMNGCNQAKLTSFEISLSPQGRLAFYLFLTNKCVRQYGPLAPLSKLMKLRKGLAISDDYKSLVKRIKDLKPVDDETPLSMIPLINGDGSASNWITGNNFLDLPGFKFPLGQEFKNFCDTAKRWDLAARLEGTSTTDDTIFTDFGIFVKAQTAPIWDDCLGKADIPQVFEHGDDLLQMDAEVLAKLLRDKTNLTENLDKVKSAFENSVKNSGPEIYNEVQWDEKSQELQDLLGSPEQEPKSEINYVFMAGVNKTIDIPVDSEVEDILGDAARNIVMAEKDLFIENGKLTNAAVCKIQLKEGASLPPKPRPRRYGNNETVQLKSYFDEQHEAGKIQHSHSEMASCVHVVKQREKSRPVMDFRKLNEITVIDPYPLPRTDACFDALLGAKFFATMDLTKSYHQVPMDKDSVPLTSFVLPFGQFEWLCMAFGLVNAPAIFQRMMNKILHEHLYKRCIVYIDDVIVFGKTKEEFLENLRMVLACLNKANLKLNPAKCCFASRQASFLGFIVRDGKKFVDPSRIQGLRDLVPPHTKKQVRSFVGLMSFFRDFFPEYLKWVGPFQELTKDGDKSVFKWTAELDECFKKCKDFLLSDAAPFLQLADPSKPFFLQTDASDYGIGGALFQLDEDNNLVPVQYIAKTMNPTQSRWCITEKEAFAVVHCLDKVRHYVLGSHVTVETDHNNLRWMGTSKSPKLQRWILNLSHFNFSIVYKPGVDNILADALSRMPLVDDVTELEAKNIDEARVLYVHSHVPVEQRRNVKGRKVFGLVCKCDDEVDDEVILPPVHPNVLLLEPSVLGEITKEQQASPNLKLWNNDKDCGVVMVKGTPIWVKKVTSTGFCHVLLVSDYKDWYLNIAHNGPTSVHVGATAMIHALNERGITWNRFSRSIRDLIAQCPACQAVKVSHGPVAHGALETRPTGGILRHWNVDFLGPVLESERGSKYVLVMIDKRSRWLELAALKVATAESTAQTIFNYLICRYQTPEIIFSDRGPHFANSLCKEMSRLLEFDWQLTIPYHPQSNGLVERRVGLVTTAISCLVDNQGTNWDLYLPTVMASRNAAVCRAIKSSPFAMVFGFTPNFPAPPVGDAIRTIDDNAVMDVEPFANRALALRQRIDAAVKTEEEYKKKTVLSWEESNKPEEFNVGDLVLYYAVVKPHKFARNFIGPFQVVEKESRVAYWIKSLVPNSISRKAHVTQLLRYNRGTRSDQELVQEAQSNSEYVPEAIRDHRVEEDGSMSMLIKWTAFPEEENTWESDSGLKHLDIYKKYMREEFCVDLARAPRKKKAKNAKSDQKQSVVSRKEDKANADPPVLRRSSRRGRKTAKAAAKQ
eukprot:TRINITY_DN920_c0_g2_i1.p1 TRINITY_DN920_c0_g2~~TRINITY_DN920_c0_g2_i1.p1  ORF type:complete len:1759 (-),score=361.37 TRINITY_DN920_c0_g2_i1:1652-6928(-)